MTLTLADPTAALAYFFVGQLSDHVGTNSQGGAAIYRPDIPQTDDKLMPQPAIAVRVAGGYKRFGQTRMPLKDPVIDALCYGDTRMASENLARAVASVCQQVKMTLVTLPALGSDPAGTVMLYAAQVVTGPLPLPDTQTLWPTTVVSVKVLHNDYLTES